MERMKLLQESQQEEEGVTQEEMATRFELEKTESLLVAPSGEEGREGSGGGPCGLGSSGGGRWGPHGGRRVLGAHGRALQTSPTTRCSPASCASWRTPSSATRTSRGGASRRPPLSVRRWVRGGGSCSSHGVLAPPVHGAGTKLEPPQLLRFGGDPNRMGGGIVT